MPNNLDMIQEGAIARGWQMVNDSRVMRFNVLGFDYAIYPPLTEMPGYSVEGPQLWVSRLRGKDVSFADALDIICEHARKLTGELME